MTNDTPFEQIYNEFRTPVLRYLQRLIGAGEAEDAAQEVFVKVHRGLRDFRKNSRLSTWVYRIATNAAVDRMRSPSFRQEQPLGMDNEETDVFYDKKTPPPDVQLIRKEMSECIRGYVDALPPHSRTILVLSELEGFKNGEIAEILGVSLDTVKIRLHRARARLKKTLEAHCSFYRDERNEFACDRKEPTLKFHKKK
ncbi:MAG TPA: RNA polymerase subunit sigma-24 [Nitrospiraceae bacterium]|nr:MAG: hypothetical protein A2Z82_02895 [Nitrospirae bacterium GWA2_46_11]HCZ11880.1 RNA polymerase subunit sigma-24 [Nitrospiraceae bacterium]